MIDVDDVTERIAAMKAAVVAQLVVGTSLVFEVPGLGVATIARAGNNVKIGVETLDGVTLSSANRAQQISALRYLVTRIKPDTPLPVPMPPSKPPPSAVVEVAPDAPVPKPKPRPRRRKKAAPK